jgi:electron transfer flavoprotein beta subunit
LKIVVCIKQVPDSAARIVAEGGQVVLGDALLVINPWDEYAVEAALLCMEAAGGEVIAITVGGEGARDILVKEALAKGCSQAILITDPALQNADSQAIARVLAAAIQKIGEVDLICFGRQAIDGDMGVTGAQTARLLGLPFISLVSAIPTCGPDVLKVERSIDEGRQVVETPLPAAISVGKDIGEVRIASFINIRKASRAVIPVWNLADLGLQTPASLVSWPAVTNPPARQVTTEMITGNSPQEIAEKLADKLMAEKVL